MNKLTSIEPHKKQNLYNAQIFLEYGIIPFIERIV